MRAPDPLAETLFELAPDAFILTDPEGTILRANLEARTLTGYEVDELVGTSVELLVPERLRSLHVGHRASFVAAPARRDMGEGRELPVLHKDGREVPTEIALAPLRTEDGLLVMVGLRDVTERRTARRELERRARLLEETNRELEAFSYSVSHDLRAPLRSIHGFSRILEEDYGEALPEEGRRYLGILRESASKMGRLIDDLLAFSRLGRETLSEGVVDLEDLVRSVFDQLRELGPDGRVGGEPNGHPEPELIVAELPPCRADRAMLAQAVTNLLANAIKFSRLEERPVIEVGSERKDGGDVVYFVRDNGVGFDPRYVDKMFGVFQRLHKEEEFEGTGVGLATVQRIIHRHGGRVWAEGAPGEGATVYFTLGREG